LGSTVECYPPQEKDFLLTQNIIKILNKNNIAVTILTKSTLIKRDLKLLAKFKNNKIYLTINFASEKIKGLFEPYSSPLKERLSLLNCIQKLNINCRVHISPLIPYIQDIKEIYPMVEKYTDGISMELYNFKMGNWLKVKEIIRENFGDKTLTKIEGVISCSENYEKFTRGFKKQTEGLGKIFNKKIALIIPDLKDYYKSDVFYE
jgi:DNA repair photolyase